MCVCVRVRVVVLSLATNILKNRPHYGTEGRRLFRKDLVCKDAMIIGVVFQIYGLSDLFFDML